MYGHDFHPRLFILKTYSLTLALISLATDSGSWWKAAAAAARARSARRCHSSSKSPMWALHRTTQTPKMIKRKEERERIFMENNFFFSAVPAGRDRDSDKEKEEWPASGEQSLSNIPSV